MKKTIIILSALLALVACSNLENSQNGGVIDASKVVFKINVDKINDPATKGLKTGWESGDVVYVFFQNNIEQYVKMTYNGSSWDYRDKDGGTNYDGLSLAASGDKLSAVYMPGFVIGEATPSYVSDKWTVGTGLGGYILTAEAVDYTVTVGNVTTLNATLSMTAPANMMQVYINESAPASGNEYVLNMTNVKPFTFDGIAPGGAATITAGNVNFPLAAYNGALGTETGYYFWGILANASAGAIDYNFQLVEQNAEKKYAISSKSKTVTGKNLTGPTAIKLSGLADNGKFVSLGYAGGPLWATGNIGKVNDSEPFDVHSNSGIVDPLLGGETFMYGKITPFNSGDEIYRGEEDPLSTDADVAFQTNNKWRIPTKNQFEDLYWNVTREVIADWTTKFGTINGLLLKSSANGISLFFTCLNTTDGSYWSSTPEDDSFGFRLAFGFGSDYIDFFMTETRRYYEYRYRPVMNN